MLIIRIENNDESLLEGKVKEMGDVDRPILASLHLLSGHPSCNRGLRGFDQGKSPPHRVNGTNKLHRELNRAEYGVDGVRTSVGRGRF